MRFWLAVLVGGLLLATESRAQNVEFMWAGGATHESIQVKAGLDSTRVVRLAVSEFADLSNPLLSATDEPGVDRDFVASLSIAGLQPDTRYFYAIREADGTLNEPFGSFRTYPQPGCQTPYDVSIAFGSDAALASNALVFETIEAIEPDVFIHLGDMHSSDIESDDITEYRSAYRTSLTRPRQSSLLRSVSSVYVWDDRDFGPNDSDSTHVGREAAKSAYLEYVPSHPLSSDSLETGIYRAFTLGRARIIVTDARYHRSPKTDLDGPAKTMLGPIQKEWLKEQLAIGNDLYPLVIWVNPVPWIETATAESDRWGGYSAEREEIAQFITDIGLNDKLVMLAGDAHMTAGDDGSYSGYASGDNPGGFAVLHASALDRPGNYKGGPYRLGAYPATMQFGLLTLTDECTDRIEVDFSALDMSNQPVESTTDFLLGQPIAFSHSYFTGGDRLLRRGSMWRYRDDGAYPGPLWTTPNFIDTGWKLGPAQLGYGDTPDQKDRTDVATEIDFGFQPQFKHLAYYFRSYFEIEDKAAVKKLVANLVVDDGAIVYINGFEALRLNMPEGLVDEETPATSAIEGASEARFQSFDLSSAVGSLFNGTNVIAVEVHQESQSSPDLSLDVELFAVTSDTAANLPPVADASATPATGDVPFEVTFDGSGSFDADGNIISYAWDFGDGVTSGQPVVAHIYDSTGTFEATLTVTDNLGRTSIANVQVVATNSPPDPVIIADPMTGETPLEVSFDASLSSDPNGTIESYYWSFGNGQTGSGEMTTHVYESPGDFWAKLRVTDNLGAVGEDSLLLVIAQGNLPPFLVDSVLAAVPEDTGTVDLLLSDFFDDDRDSTNTLTYTFISVTNQQLFAALTLDDSGGGAISFRPAPDSNGVSEIVVEVLDSGGLMTRDSLAIEIRSVNDAPVFTAGSDTVITTDAGRVSLDNWAKGISSGPPDEAGQSLAFEIENSAPLLFADQPVLSPDGTLTMEPAADTSGLAELRITLRDDGGTEWGGSDSSTVIIAEVRTNHRPQASFEFVRESFGSLTVLFNASTSTDPDGTIETYKWNFGDGSEPQFGIEVTHTFPEAVPTDAFLTVTDDHGATGSTQSNVAVSTESEELPDVFETGEFYPNPGTGQVSLDIALPDARHVTIELIDVAGRLVKRETFDERPGRHRHQLNVALLPSGLYLARVTAGDDLAIRRLVVLR